MSERGLLIVVSAPAGCGKTTIIKELRRRRPDIGFSVSATTRPPRPGDVDGRDYFFVSKPEFEAMIASGELLEYAEYVGNYYGTPRRAVEERLAGGSDIVLDIEVQGAFQVKAAMPDAVSVFLLPPSFEELERRLVTRGTETAETIAKRLATAKTECARADEYDFRIVNDRVERAVSELEEVIDRVKAERK